MRLQLGMFVYCDSREFFHQGSTNSDAAPNHFNQLWVNPADVVANLAYEHFLGLMPDESRTCEALRGSLGNPTPFRVSLNI